MFSQFSVVPASAKTTNKDRKMPVLKRGNREHVKIKPDSGSVTPGYRLHALVIDEIFLSKTSKGHVARVWNKTSQMQDLSPPKVNKFDLYELGSYTSIPIILIWQLLARRMDRQIRAVLRRIIKN